MYDRDPQIIQTQRSLRALRTQKNTQFTIVAEADISYSHGAWAAIRRFSLSIHASFEALILVSAIDVQPLETEGARLNNLSKQVIGAAMRVHSHLGVGLLESAYDHCLYFELVDLGLSVERQVPVPLVYRGRKLDCGYRVDLLAEKQLIVEVKALDKLHPVHCAQLLSQLRITRVTLGLLINFHERPLRNGIRRIVNRFPE